MRYGTRVKLAFNRLQRRYQLARDKGLYQVSALIRSEARQIQRYAPVGRSSVPGTPPRAHRRGGLKEINFHVQGHQSIIGPRKFPRSKFFNRPVPNIHERGGIAVATTIKRRYQALYPERSFMYEAVKRLKAKNKIAPRFSATIRSSW